MIRLKVERVGVEVIFRSNWRVAVRAEPGWKLGYHVRERGVELCTWLWGIAFFRRVQLPMVLARESDQVETSV